MSVQALKDFFGFGLKNCRPNNLPKPKQPLLIAEGLEKTEHELSSEIVLSTYNILEDDKRLRNSVETFEKQRGDYPLRYEFFNYTVQLNSNLKKMEKRILQLGFKTQ